MWARRVFGDQTVTIGSDVIHESIKKIKANLHLRRHVLHKHSEKKKVGLPYYAAGAKIAKDILKLERIVLELQVYELKAKINEQIAVLQKQYYGR